VKPILILLLLAVPIMVAGCGGSDARISKLEGRVAKLEAENAQLRKKVERTWASQSQLVLESTGKIDRLDDRTWANDQALYYAARKAQYAVDCGPSYTPGCHVPFGEPGAIYTESGKPRRISATPYP